MRGAGNDLSFPNTTSYACDFNAYPYPLGCVISEIALV